MSTTLHICLAVLAGWILISLISQMIVSFWDWIAKRNLMAMPFAMLFLFMVMLVLFLYFLISPNSLQVCLVFGGILGVFRVAFPADD